MDQLSDIFGQQIATDWLRQAISADRLPHALIFAGPRGVGKGTCATALGAWLLCSSPKGANCCKHCDSCKLMAAGNHPDFHVVTKELIRYHDKTGKSKGIDLSINVIRPELIEPAARKPSMGRGKVFVVEQAELMTTGAQNALLKTLEEPAGRTLIILLTDQPEILLSTIRSRSQIVRFSKLSDDVILKELSKRNISPSDAQDAARFSDGSLGLAIQWLSDGVVALARELTTMLDRGTTDTLPEWFKKAAESYAQKQLERDELASKDQATREGHGVFLRIAADHLRQKLGSGLDSTQMDSCAGRIESLAQAEALLDGNVNTSLVFQQLSMRLANR